MINKEKIVIVGVGPAGIGAALTLGDLGIVLERSGDIGGLSGTIEFEGAIFDYGGHSFHTPHSDIRELVFNSLDMYEQRRDARCFTHGSLIAYPFQKHYREIDDARVVEECARGLEYSDERATAANFEEYIMNKFGPGIAEHFMLPYNRKLWGRDLERLAAYWVSERVAAPEGTKEKFSLTGGKRKPLQDDTVVSYPARGGYHEIYKALAKKIKTIRYNAELERVDPLRKAAYTRNGEVFRWEKLISTLPINLLLEMVDGAPSQLLADAAKLEHLSLKLVLVVIDHPVDTEIQRIYSAASHIPAHKTVVNHNSSDYLRRLPHHGIMAEVSYSSEKEFMRDDLDTWVVESLQEMKLIKGLAEVRMTKVINVKFAYPVPTFSRDAIITRIKTWLRERDIYTVGRFGEWAYINSDEAIHRGMVLGRSVLEN